MSEKELKALIAKVEKEMRKAAADLNFEAAIDLREQLKELSSHLNA